MGLIIIYNSVLTVFKGIELIFIPNVLKELFLYSDPCKQQFFSPFWGFAFSFATLTCPESRATHCCATPACPECRASKCCTTPACPALPAVDCCSKMMLL